MNQINARDIGQHIVIVGWRHIVGSALSLGIGTFVFSLLTGIGVVSGDAEAFTILNLVNFPIGTIIGIYTLWVLFQDSAADYFAIEQVELHSYKGQSTA